MAKQAVEKWLALAIAEIGVKEVPGRGHNPVVLAYFRDAGHPEIRDDETPWCAAFVGACLYRAGVYTTGSMLARSYLKWGYELKKPVPGCVAIFPRGADPTYGHVTFVLAVHGNVIDVIGGNQHNSVCVVSRMTTEALSFRWPYDPANDLGPEHADPVAPVLPPVRPIDPPVRSPDVPVAGKADEAEAPEVAEKELRDAGSRTLSATDSIDTAAKTVGGLAAILATVKTMFAGLDMYLQAALGVSLVGALTFVWWQSRKIKEYRVEDHATGKVRKT